MKSKSCNLSQAPELTDDQKAQIIEAFYEKMEDKLRRMDARTGTLNCGFAGPEFEHWVLTFRSTRSGFQVVGFEYDEDSRGFSKWMEYSYQEGDDQKPE